MLITESKNCTGCGACANICPHNALNIVDDKFGFLKPVVNNKLCTGCNLCKNICPILNFNCHMNGTPEVYALIYKNDEILQKSSSGGAFYAFAQKVIKSNGTVYGVIWDKNIKAIHARAANLDEIEKMHGSKYVQSDTNTTFRQVKKDLEKGLHVLYTGTPCQIAGLQAFLRKDYDKLHTIDLICNGTQSRLLLERYKQNFMLDKNTEEFISNINFRSKKQGWGNYFTVITTNKNTYEIQNDLYPQVMNISTNYCCSECKFNKIPRIGDITIGDFWGVEAFDNSLDNKKGVSIILVNSINGKSLLQQIDDTCILRKVPLKTAIKKNPNITGLIKLNREREQFIKEISNPNLSYNKIMKHYTKIPFYITIYRTLPLFIKNFIRKKLLQRY